MFVFIFYYSPTDFTLIYLSFVVFYSRIYSQTLYVLRHTHSILFYTTPSHFVSPFDIHKPLRCFQNSHTTPITMVIYLQLL